MSDTAYRATPERAGFAIATGAAGGGLVVAAAQFFGGEFDAGALSGGFVLGMLASGVAIVLVGGPLWWLFQRRGRRGPVAAAATGALVGFLVMVALQTDFFGLGLPAEDGLTITLRWLSAVTVGAVAAIAGAGIALAMWLVGYRAIYLGPVR